MIAVYILLGILALLALLWFLPLRLKLRYDGSGGTVRLWIGPKLVSLYPKPQPSEKKRLRQEAKAEKKHKKQKDAPEEKDEAKSEASLLQRIGGDIPKFRRLLALGTEAVGKLLRKLRVTDFNITLSLGTQGRDPARTALLYGSGWSALGALVPFLERHFRIRDRAMDVRLDTESAEDRILAQGTLHILLGELLHIAVVYGIRGLKIYRTPKEVPTSND